MAVESRFSIVLSEADSFESALCQHLTESDRPEEIRRLVIQGSRFKAMVEMMHFEISDVDLSGNPSSPNVGCDNTVIMRVSRKTLPQMKTLSQIISEYDMIRSVKQRGLLLRSLILHGFYLESMTWGWGWGDSLKSVGATEIAPLLEREVRAETSVPPQVKTNEPDYSKALDKLGGLM